MTNEPPGLGAPFVSLVPAVDDAGNDRAGIRLPQVAVPLATHTGWNYRQPSIGAPTAWPARSDRICRWPAPAADRERSGDGRASIDERYASREDYLGRIAMAAIALVTDRFLLPEDVAGRDRAGGATLGLGDGDRAC